MFFVSSTNAFAIFNTNDMEYGVVPEGNKKLRFITNHDESNIATPPVVFGSNEAAFAAFVITCCLEGVPLIYCGQEAGVSSSSVYSGYNFINWSLNPELQSDYKQLLAVYNSNESLRKGILETFPDNNAIIFTKTYNSSEAAVIVNTRSGNQTFAVPVALQGSWTNAFDNTQVILADSLSMAGYDYLLLKK